MKLLEDTVECHATSIQNPMNGMDYLVVGFHGAVFKKDFGPWKAGEKAYDLIFDPFHSTLTQVNQDEEIIKSCKVVLVAQGIER